MEYALPTSEKQYVGNIPMGSKFSGKGLGAGIYWENSGGARDLDLSGNSLFGKIGWNDSYNNHELTYSGDITSAPKGAVEYLYARNLSTPYLVLNNVYSGEPDCSYRIIVGEVEDNRSRGYMMNPNNLLAYADVESAGRESVVGLFFPNGLETSFVLLNLAKGAFNVSRQSDLNEKARVALLHQYQNYPYLNELLAAVGVEMVTSAGDADDGFDLAPQTLQKDTLINLFK